MSEITTSRMRIHETTDTDFRESQRNQHSPQIEIQPGGHYGAERQQKQHVARYIYQTV